MMDSRAAAATRVRGESGASAPSMGACRASGVRISTVLLIRQTALSTKKRTADTHTTICDRSTASAEIFGIRPAFRGTADHFLLGNRIAWPRPLRFCGSVASSIPRSSGCHGAARTRRPHKCRAIGHGPGLDTMEPTPVSDAPVTRYFSQLGAIVNIRDRRRRQHRRLHVTRQGRRREAWEHIWDRNSAKHRSTDATWRDGGESDRH